MNTFSNLLDTELFLELTLRIRSVGDPWLKISINNHDVACQFDSTNMLSIHHKLPLLDPFSIRIELVEKDYMAAHETAAIIEQLSIDDFDVVPAWTQLAQYNNDHNYHDPTNYLGFIGVRQLLIDRPFYQWTHVVTNQGMLLQIDQ